MGKMEHAMGQFLMYTDEDGTLKLDVRFENESVWLTQQLMVELFQTTKQNISLHIQNIYEEGELLPEATVKEYLTVQTEGKRAVKRMLDYYNLDMIISVGYRIKSHVATRFRMWATQKITDIYTTSIDYDPKLDMSIEFFRTVQNKMHWAITGQTAAEIIHSRADADKQNMGLTNYRGAKVRKQDN